MESFTQMADRWISENLPASRVHSVAKEAKYAKEAASASMFDHNPAAWEDDFHNWGLSDCTFRERSFHSIRHLHALFCEWCISTDRVPCRLDTFESLLYSEGFCFADGLVYGLRPAEPQPQRTTNPKGKKQ